MNKPFAMHTTPFLMLHCHTWSATQESDKHSSFNIHNYFLVLAREQRCLIQDYDCSSTIPLGTPDAVMIKQTGDLCNSPVRFSYEESGTNV